MLVAYRHGHLSSQRADIHDDAHEALRQHFEQVLVQPLADPDVEAGLLAHFSHQSRAVILAGIGTPSGQIPFASLVYQQEDTAPVQYDAFDRKRVG